MWMDSDREDDELEGYYYEPAHDPDRDPDYQPEYVPARRPKEKPGDPAAYWRRRFVILAGGIAALGLCAWLIPGGHAGPGTSAAVRESAAALATRDTLPSAALGPAYEKHVPVATTDPSPTVSKVATTAPPKPKVTEHPTSSASASASSGGSCAPRDIVLSLFTTAPSYAQNALPAFDVYAVSTAATACTMSYGPGAVQVIVTSNGHVVWNSAACKPPPGVPVRLTRGVPHELTVSWNRQATKPSGCGGFLPAGTSGTFDVVAIAAGQSSPVATFILLKSLAAERGASPSRGTRRASPSRGTRRAVPPGCHPPQ